MSDRNPKAHTSDELTPDAQGKPVPADQEPYNLEHRDDPEKVDTGRPPTREVGEDDFAAEAHGFTGFERAGKAGEKPNGPGTGKHPDTNKEPEP